YPEYTGTIVEAILHKDGPSDLASIRLALAPKNIGVSEPLGFNNTYALAIPRALGEARGLRRISDLARAPDLRIGLSHGLRGRRDGWRALGAGYGFAEDRAAGLDHGLAYEAIKRGSIDVTDVYSPDAQIKRLDLRVLEDDRHVF